MAHENIALALKRDAKFAGVVDTLARSRGIQHCPNHPISGASCTVCFAAAWPPNRGYGNSSSPST